MVDAIGARSFTQRSSIPCDSEVSLPCILGRLTKLEAEGLSYDELLHDFANRRRVAPVDENRPVKNVVDPAQETDEIVQAYLSLTRGDCLAWATRWGCSRSSRIPYDARISRATTVGRPRRQPQTRPTSRDVGKSTIWQDGLNDSFAPRKRGRLMDTVNFPAKLNTIAGVDDIGLPKKCDRQLEVGQPEGRYGGNEHELRILENLQRRIHYEYALGGELVDLDHWAPAIEHEDQDGSNTSPNLRSSDEFSRDHQDSFNYYPSRAESAEVLVSLVSARTSKKIRRLPSPGRNEQEKLQRVEHAARTFSAQALELRTKDGLYSTLTRRGVGLTNTDIDELTATVTDQPQVSAAAERTAVAESIAKHSGGVLSRLLRPKSTPPLPTVNPRCFLGHVVGSSPSTDARLPTRPFSQRQSRRDGHKTRYNVRGGELRRANEVMSDEGLKASERVRIVGADKREHSAKLSHSLCRLRALLEGSPDGDGGQPGSSSPFSINELRMLGVAKRRRPESGCVEDRETVYGDEHANEADKKTTQGVAVELSLEGNPMLRQLAIALMLSVQRRIQKGFLRLGFRKWQALVQSFGVSRYLEATVLLQSYMRRTLAIMEASERRRLQNDQVRREKCANELVVRSRQQGALKVQKWLRGEAGRRLAAQKLSMLRAARVVQRTMRAKQAQVVALKQRDEMQRCRRAVGVIQRRVRETRKRNHTVLMQRVEELKQKELLLQQRCYELQQHFRREGAAIRIQAVWRARVMKRNLTTFVRIGKRQRAIRIQRAVRGFLARRELQRRKKAFETRFAKEIAAAIKIQSLGRRGLAWNKVDERRFQRNRDQLVSTLDAERALRDRKREVPILKAVAAKEGTIIAAAGKGKPYIIDPVALKVMLADKKRAVNPWQDSTDSKAATKIQAMWRGYRQVVRVRRMRVRQRREKAQLRRAKQLKGVQNLQRVFRGRRGRLEAKSRRYGLRAVRIQKVWRGFQGRRSAADRRQRIQAAILLQRRLRGAQARSLANRMRHEAITTRAPAVKIQSAGRRYLARRLRLRLVTDGQIEWEWSTMAKEMARFCAERARLRVIVEGAAAPSCKGDGVTQFIFRKLANKRSGEEGSGSFRLEGRAFAKLFAGTPGLFGTAFHATDTDLIFARVKDKEERTITYGQFASALSIVAATLFPEVKRFRDFRAFKPKAARLLELVEGSILQAPGATEYRQVCLKSGNRYLYRSAGKIQAAARGRLGRKRFQRQFAEKDKEARAIKEGIMVIRIQALARRFCARCLAIRVAQARFAKYIDPTTALPYWVHPGTGVTSWTKPKIFGAQDAEHATMVATSKTEHLVKCSICDERRVKRLCKSCRDGYCDECFLALHGKGHRREHIAPIVPMCCVCEYQHGSRLCETCTFKTSCTCAYCDVCFFSRHPGLDLLMKADERRDKGWSMETNTRQTGWDHRWTPLVVTCMECRRYAARWLCDDCEEVYCVGCYASVHRHGIKVNHGAEKLPYYTADFHMEYAMACRKRSRALKEEEADALWLEEQERMRQRAATLIQAGWRGRIGRINGRAHSKAERVAQRKAWRQRKRDNAMRKTLWYAALDLGGLAPALKSDTVEEQALRGVPRMARKTPKKYITLNREDDAWVPGKLDERKGIIKRGFEVGNLSELKDQAKRGGVRLPGRHAVMTSHRSIYTDPAYEMKDFLKPKQVVRVEGEIFRVEAILPDRIRVDHVWHKPDANDVLLYKMVLTKRQKFLQGATRTFWTSQPVQYAIQGAIIVEEDMINGVIRRAAMRCKKRRRKKLYGLAKKTLKHNEENIRSLKLILNTAQFGLDRPPIVEKETSTRQGGGESNAAPPDAVMGWVEKEDQTTGRPVWQNNMTGEVTFARPTGFKARKKELEELAEQKELLVSKRARRKR